MAALKAYDALAAEREAAEAEGIFAPTATQIAELRRYADLGKRMDAIKVEMEAIKVKIVSEMEDIGASKLAVNGKNWVNIVPNKKPVDVLDRDTMETEHPEVVQAYVKLLLKYTSQVPATGRKVTVKPV